MDFQGLFSELAGHSALFRALFAWDMYSEFDTAWLHISSWKQVVFVELGDCLHLPISRLGSPV